MSRLTRVMVLSLVLVLTMSLGLSAVSAQDDSVLIIGFEQEPPNLRPLNTLTFGGLTQNFYARDLWGWNTDREIFPIMVEEIPTFENGMVEINEDGNTVVTVKLREDMVWSDGEPITSADCELMHRLKSDRSTSDSLARGSYPDAVADFAVVDEYTFAITYNGVFPDYLTVDPEKPECRYPEHIFGPMIEDGGKLEESDYFTTGGTVGYGPYVLTEWNIGENMIYEKNENWDGQEGAWDRIIVQFIPDDTQMRNALEVGEIDIAFNWSDDLQPIYDAMDGIETFSAPGVYTDALWIRMGPNGTEESPGSVALQDPLVRQAIAHAIDRLTIAEELVAPGIPVPTSWYPAQLWPEDLPFLEYDPERAVALLEEAGWTDTNGDGTVDKDGVELTGLRFITTENTLRNNYQLVIQEYLAEIGIGTDIQIIPATNMFASFADRGALTTYQWDLSIFANSADPLSPLTDRDAYICDAIPSAENPDGFNGWQFCDPEYDALDAQIATTQPGPERDELIGQAITHKFEGYFWHGLRLRNTWFAVNANVVDPASVEANVGTLADNWFYMVENWVPAS